MEEACCLHQQHSSEMKILLWVLTLKQVISCRIQKACSMWSKSDVYTYLLFSWHFWHPRLSVPCQVNDHVKQRFCKCFIFNLHSRCLRPWWVSLWPWGSLTCHSTRSTTQLMRWLKILTDAAFLNSLTFYSVALQQSSIYCWQEKIPHQVIQQVPKGAQSELKPANHLLEKPTDSNIFSSMVIIDRGRIIPHSNMLTQYQNNGLGMSIWLAAYTMADCLLQNWKCKVYWAAAAWWVSISFVQGALHQLS